MKIFGFSRPNSAHSALSTCLKKWKSEQAQSLIELAISVPVFALLVFGAVEVGKVIYASVEVSDAAMAGVEYGTRTPTAAADSGGIQNAAASDASNLTLVTNSSLSCICSDGTASTCLPTDCSGSNIETILTVQTQSTVDPLIYLPGLPRSYTLRGQAIQKVLQ